MKIIKHLKSGLVGMAIITPVVATSMMATSCGKKSPKTTASFADFSKAAMKESPENVVTQTNPKGWEKLPTGDLSPSVPPASDANAKTVTFVLVSKSLSETATFVATFHDQAYSLSDWKCTIAPKNNKAWEEYKDAVVTWAKNQGTQGKFSVTDVAKKIKEQANFPASWKTGIDSGYTFIAVQTANKTPDNVNHVMYYTIELSAIWMNISDYFTCDLSITQSGDSALSLNDFKVLTNHELHYNETSWYNDMKGYLINMPQDASKEQALLASIDPLAKSTRWPNLNKFFANHKYQDMTFTIDDSKISNVLPVKPVVNGNTLGEIKFSLKISTQGATISAFFYVNWTDKTHKANYNKDYNFTTIEIFSDGS